jgi:2-keto-4-pentenoate hydratase/2-oxohepta-3-ene-1,7-dioic acid hydratase in catechol pathway
MKLIRVGKEGFEKPGVWLSETEWVDVSSFISDFDEKFWVNPGIEAFEKWFSVNQTGLPRFEKGSRLGSPIARPSKIICIGLNYADHALESKMEPPAEPVIFFKSTTALQGPFDEVMIPKGSEKTDWEVELAIVIGKKASHVSENEALDYVAGYTLHNDYSERAFQLERGGQWVKGKSCDTFAPVGPFLATRDEIANVHHLGIWLKVNEEIKQNGNTSNLIFKVPFLVSYLSQFMTLLPGDLISTGTPAGVGLGFNPPQYLSEGDVVSLGIDGLGSSSQKLVSWRRK